jgi:glucose-6-phosphate 1-dehydrogenase
VWPHICNLLKQRCMSETGWNRLVLEKPFGPSSPLFTPTRRIASTRKCTANVGLLSC